jgi:P4 family phage/plasmid primase-like protien
VSEPHVVTVFSDKYVKGWSGGLDKSGGPVIVADGRCRQGELLEALGFRYPHDAHFSPYALFQADGSPYPHPMRVNQGEHVDTEKGLIPALGLRISFSALVVDVDAPGHEKAEDAWVESQVAIAEALPVLGDVMGWYQTRGGYRLLWLLPHALPPARFLRVLSSLVTRLERAGLGPDRFRDWTRVYRLPRVTRDGKMQELPADWSWLAPLPDAVVEELEAEHKGPFAGIDKVRAPLVPGAQIPRGKRNVTLLRLAGTFRHAGMGEVEILSALQGVNATRCVDDPLDDAELAQIARNVCRYDAPADAALLPVAPQARSARILPLAERGEGSKDSAGVGTAAPDSGDDFPFGGPEDTLPCDPGSNAGVVPATAQSGTPSPREKKPPSPNAPRFFLGSEIEIADAAAQEIEGEGEPLLFDRGHLWQYDPEAGVWQDIAPEKVYGTVASFDGEWIVTGADKNGNPKTQPLKVSARLCREARFLVQARRRVVGFFDTPQEGLTFANGFFRIEPGGVAREEFSPEQRQLASLPYDFIPNAQPTQFLAMLRECFARAPDADGKISLLREFIGAALCNQATVYQKALILTGDGANGKSTVQSIVAALFPENVCTSVNPQDMNNEYRRALLFKARLNVVSELPEADILASEGVKAIIDGSQILAREIRQAPFKFHPRAAHLFSTNRLPASRDMSRGFWRRWIVIHFDREFAESDQDKDLANRIIRSELPEIASWAMEGAAHLAERGFYSIPDSSQAALDEWRLDTDQVSLFLDQEMKILPEDSPKVTWMTGRAVYDLYVQWARTNGHGQMSNTLVGKRLVLLKVPRAKRPEANVWALNVRLRTTGNIQEGSPKPGKDLLDY